MITGTNGHTDPQFGYRENIMSNSHVDKFTTYNVDLLKALHAAQMSAKPVEKDSKNSHHGYKYASAESVIEESRSCLHANGLGVMASSWGLAGDSRMHVTYVLFHTSGATAEFTCETTVVPEKGRPQDKAEATALTYNLSYFLRGLLCLARVEEGTDVDQRKDGAGDDASFAILRDLSDKLVGATNLDWMQTIAGIAKELNADGKLSDKDFNTFKAAWVKRKESLK